MDGAGQLNMPKLLFGSNLNPSPMLVHLTVFVNYATFVLIKLYDNRRNLRRSSETDLGVKDVIIIDGLVLYAGRILD